MDAAKRIILLLALVVACALPASALTPSAPENRVWEKITGTLETHQETAPQVPQSHQEETTATAETASECFLAAKGVEDLVQAGNVLDKGGILTKAGRGLDKHGIRPKTSFPQAIGNAAAKNSQGEQVLREILESNQQVIKPNRFGGRDIFDSNTTRGVRFDANGNMMGFLEGTRQ